MSGAAIRVEGLGKVYRIGGPVEEREAVGMVVSQIGIWLRPKGEDSDGGW